MEMLLYIAENAALFCLIFMVLMGLLIKWICLVLDTGRETVRSFRLKLVSYAMVVCVVLFAVSWYAQILSDVTNDLKTMSKNADVAVETLDAYEIQRNKLNDWLDEFYVDQCWIAGRYVTMQGRENLTREELRRLTPTT